MNPLTAPKTPLQQVMESQAGLRFAVIALSFFGSRRLAGHRALVRSYARKARQHGWRGSVRATLSTLLP